MDRNLDTIVIGSGFGGAIVACRLALRGYRVLVLERGRRWEASEYPREIGDAWFWDDDRPERRHGWLDLRFFPRIGIAQGAGVGGGSLVYANISINAAPDLFKSGWPEEITYETLLPYYDRVGQVLNVRPVPEGQWPARTKLMREAAQSIGYGERFRTLDLAVSFDDEWTYAQARDPSVSKRFTNAQGQEQGMCVHLGNCDIGCDVRAKNTLDLNYIPLAEQYHAEVRPLHIARKIEPDGDGYCVHFDRIVNGRLQPGTARARIVVLAAGSLGSTELLLRCRDQYKTLPDVSRTLGLKWSGNGDFLTPAPYAGREVLPTAGPTITSAIDFQDGAVSAQRFFIEDGGLPDVLANWLRRAGKGRSWRASRRALLGTFRELANQPINQTMLWFAQGRDAADGTLQLRKKWWLFGRKRLVIDWHIAASKPLIDTIVSMHERLAEATGGLPLVPPTWSWAKYLITPHPLGGCAMGDSAESAVVDHKGEVFNYRGLFVADGAIVPKAIGVNPSKTIAALAERIAEQIATEGR